VPGTNTDGTRPANVSRAEVYAITVPVTATPLTDEQLLKLGSKVGSVQVKAPRDPNLTADADDPSEEVEAPEGPGLDQGAAAHLEEPLTAEMLKPVQVPADGDVVDTDVPDDDAPGPLLAPPPAVLSRTYVAYATSTRGRKGPLSPRIAVPLVPPPPAPPIPAIAYDESNITVTWPAVGTRAPIQAPTDGSGAEVLPSTPLEAAAPTVAYNVYDTTDPGSAVKLTATPVPEPRFVDSRMVWGEKRCYTVRTAESVGGMTIESDASPAGCETLVDTFPPAAPKGVAGIPSVGAINLIWEPNSEKDLAGYIVMRAAAATATLEPITPAPIQETSFKDGVQSGMQFFYSVKAVDKSGNASPSSTRVAETAR
jgi:hypothetical protein